MTTTQAFDLFGTPDAPVVTKAKPTTHQQMLFVAGLFDHVNPDATPAEPIALDPQLHDATIDDAPAADTRPEIIDVADLTDADIATLAAGATLVDDAYLEAKRARLDAAPAQDDDGFAFAGVSTAELAATPDVTAATPPAAAAPTGPTPGTRRVATSSGGRDYRYIGQVRDGRDGPVIAECGHEHTNRDTGRSALECARDVIAGARRPATAEHVAGRWTRRWEQLTRGTGHTYTATTIAAARAAADDDAEAYLSAVAAVRAHPRT